jgi:hypothetical protein
LETVRAALTGGSAAAARRRYVASAFGWETWRTRSSSSASSEPAVTVALPRDDDDWFLSFVREGPPVLAEPEASETCSTRSSSSASSTPSATGLPVFLAGSGVRALARTRVGADCPAMVAGDVAVPLSLVAGISDRDSGGRSRVEGEVRRV